MALILKNGEYLRITKGTVNKQGFEYRRFKNKAEREKFTSEQLDGTSLAMGIPMSQKATVVIDMTVKVKANETLQDVLVATAYPYLKNLSISVITPSYPFKDATDDIAPQ